MKTYHIQTKLWLPERRDRVFEFFCNPHNLDRITPPWLHFQILTPPSTPMQRGMVLDYRLRIRGLPVRWQSEIAEWESPRRFIDRQTRGPYSLWIHEHTFEEHQGGTFVEDKVEYAVPGGKFVQKFFVAPDLDRVFKYRHHVLEVLFNPNKLTAENLTHPQPSQH
ncbi:MAG TPA: SRPBCC family protein [Candidatus Binatia bacterium]|jgi:ligand-binding SRPBCC domain-containing protein